MSKGTDEIVTEPVRRIVCGKCGKPLEVAGLAAFSRFRCGHCAAVQTVPARFGNFLLIEFLGQGGMGVVYRALDQALGRQVALKVMLKAVAADRMLFDQFTREARSAATLSHPNIVQIYSLGEEKGQPFIVMELLSGGRMDQMIGEGKVLDEAPVLKIGAEVVEGLSAAQRAGLIHDDIKPENILFDSKGVAKVVDFGLARFRGMGPEAGKNEIWGTPYYIAPEKVTRQTPDFRSDIYSLGGTLFHALAGRPPFEGSTALEVVKARLLGPAPDLRHFRPGVRPETAALLARMLEREPARRPASYAALQADIRLLTGAPPAGEAGTAGSPAPGGDGAGPKSTRVIIKGKKKLTLPGAAPAPGEAPKSEPEPPRKKKKSAKPLVWTLLILLLLAGIGTGLFLMIRQMRSRRTADGRQAEYGRLMQEAAGVFADYESAVTGLLAGAEAMYFYDDEAIAHLAEARTALGAIGEQAALVPMPTLPSEGELARRVEGPVVGIFPSVTNLEAMRAEAVLLAADLARARDAVPPDALRRAQQGVRRLRAIDTESRRVGLAVEEARKTAARAVEEGQEWIRRAEETRVSAAGAAERQAAELEAQRQREAEAAERRRLEEERLARIEAERARVNAAWQAQERLLRENAFGEAAAAMAGALTGLETEEGRAAARNAAERFERMQELKEHLIEEMREKPLRWGWFTEAGSQVDITGASPRGIEVRGQNMPWSAVSVLQMVRLMEAYVKSDEAREKKGKRGIARLQLAAAVYLQAQGERAYTMARAYADLAEQNDFRLSADTARLMPDLRGAP